MNFLDLIIEDNLSKIHNKRVIEIASGDSYLSVAAAAYAQKVLCTDGNREKLSDIKDIPENMNTAWLDARELHKVGEIFDTVLCLNSLVALEPHLKEILMSYKQMQPKKCFLFITTTPIDRTMIYDLLLPLLDQLKLRYSIKESSVYLSVEIK